MKKTIVGILAHVDAGKTTLSESMLYECGKIRQMGRVDNKDAYLDTFELEKARGITIFSKQALMTYKDTEMTLLDTPGHVDFSAEMERTLQVLDYAILVISGSDGVQSHTRTLWELLSIYRIPTFIFVNKMDQKGTDRNKVLIDLQKELSDKCIPFDVKGEDYLEALALCDEDLMDDYLESGKIEDSKIVALIENRKTFPVYFGSALKQVGVQQFLDGFATYSNEMTYPKSFGAKVFKITRDSQGNRLTHMKITGGSLKVRDSISTQGLEEKVNQIRVYSGDKYQAVNDLNAGGVCAVTGLTKTKAGEGLGREKESNPPLLEPVLSYQVILPQGVDERQLLPKLREIEEEEPELRVVWNEVLQTISIQVMGAVQLEILQSMILDRFQVEIGFDHGVIVYKETINNTCEGVGHFEPLRHYAEVHLLLEAGERGSGLQFDTTCSEDILDKNWQRLVLTHLNEKDHIGVLTGAHITDIKVTLVTGRAHNKHTAGGDFREATYRALRQGLMEADSILLEPYYRFRLVLPETFVGRAMTDIDKMSGQCRIDHSDGTLTTLLGEAPVSTMQNYQKEVNAYTKGEGRLSIAVKGYDVCHNQEAVIERFDYDVERDIDNPTGSVFCSHGSGYLVSWDEVKAHMHVDAFLKPTKDSRSVLASNEGTIRGEDFISLEEIDQIMAQTHYANQGKKSVWKTKKTAKDSYYASLDYKAKARDNRKLDEFLLVDGYNIIFSWPEFEELAKVNMDGARAKLMDILSNYQPIRKCQMMLVFDAYRVAGGRESVEEYHNIKVVFTGEAQTADHFIEKFAHANNKKYRVTVATSDGLQQIIIRGAGASLMSSRELRNIIFEAEDEISKDHLSQKSDKGTKLEDLIDDKAKEGLTKINNGT